MDNINNNQVVYKNIDDECEVVDDVFYHAYGSIVEELFDAGGKEAIVIFSLSQIKKMCRNTAPYSRDNLYPLKKFLLNTQPGGKCHGATNIRDTVQRIAIFLIWHAMPDALELLIKDGPFEIRINTEPYIPNLPGKQEGQQIGLINCEPYTALDDMLRHNKLFNKDVYRTILVLHEHLHTQEIEHVFNTNNMDPRAAMVLFHLNIIKFNQKGATAVMHKLGHYLKDEVPNEEDLKHKIALKVKEICVAFGASLPDVPFLPEVKEEGPSNEKKVKEEGPSKKKVKIEQ